MKQVVQYPRAGTTAVIDVPPPAAAPGQLLVRTRYSVISAGTERAAVQASAGGLIQQARARPDLAHRVLEKVRRDGVVSTARAVAGRVNPAGGDTPVALGYSAAGVVIEAGAGVVDFSPGDGVACAGAGHASHAEVIAVPRNLCARVPDGVPLDAAAFTTLGAIAMQGVRVTAPALGEVVVVIGLGLIGLLTVQLLRRTGCRVLATDLRTERAQLARSLGAESAVVRDTDLRQEALRLTEDHGVDAVVLTAATRSSGPVAVAGELCREKGRVVVVGDVGLNVPRTVYYQKEIDLRLSRSYGPGRYDPAYEQHGVDYPYGYVRWTEQRNMASFLSLLAREQITVAPLITHRFPIERGGDAYNLLVGTADSVPAAANGAPDAGTGPASPPQDGDSPARPLGIVLEYPELDESITRTRRVPTAALPAAGTEHSPSRRSAGSSGVVRLGVIGAGGFARAVLLPLVKRIEGVELSAVATATGLSAHAAARQFGFRTATTDPDDVIADPAIDAVIVATRHDRHADFAARALDAGKAVFVEKPLGLDVDELRRALTAQRRSGRVLMVGFNRRFAPLLQEARSGLVDRRSPMTLTYRINAGPLPPGNWVSDPVQGGGRIVAEGCHFVDLFQHVVGARPVYVSAHGFASPGQQEADNVVAVVRFEDGSVGTMVYVSASDRATGKERFEGFTGEFAFAIDDFRMARFAQNGRVWTRRHGWFGQDKGHGAEVRAFIAAVRAGGPSPVDPVEAARASLVTFGIRKSLAAGAGIDLDDSELLEEPTTE